MLLFFRRTTYSPVLGLASCPVTSPQTSVVELPPLSSIAHGCNCKPTCDSDGRFVQLAMLRTLVPPLCVYPTHWQEERGLPGDHKPAASQQTACRSIAMRMTPEMERNCTALAFDTLRSHNFETFLDSISHTRPPTLPSSQS